MASDALKIASPCFLLGIPATGSSTALYSCRSYISSTNRHFDIGIGLQAGGIEHLIHRDFPDDQLLAQQFSPLRRTGCEIFCAWLSVVSPFVNLHLSNSWCRWEGCAADYAGVFDGDYGWCFQMVSKHKHRIQVRPLLTGATDRPRRKWIRTTPIGW
jgi:hypothetical protein